MIVRRSLAFWLAVVAFQLVYGVIVFTVARQIYEHPSTKAEGMLNTSREAVPGLPHPVPQGMPSQSAVLLPGSERITLEDVRSLVNREVGTRSAATATSPEDLSREADRHFQAGLFRQAAAEYARLLEQAPDNVDLYNNLGLTLHYVGRSHEAVEILKKGIAIDATHQRIWLTLGFVQSGVGDLAAARRALGTAADLGPDSKVGLEAKRLLEDLR